MGIEKLVNMPNMTEMGVIGNALRSHRNIKGTVEIAVSVD